MVASYDLKFRRRMSSIASDGLHLWHLVSECMCAYTFACLSDALLPSPPPSPLPLPPQTKQMDATSNGASPFAGRKLMTEIFFPQMMYTKVGTTLV